VSERNGDGFGGKDAFSSLARRYDVFRPRYPDAALDEIKWFANPIPKGLVVDVGTGTGILLRQLRHAFPDQTQFVGIDPNIDMLRQARSAFILDESVRLIEASAEEIPLPTNSACLVTVAQALHWMDRKRFYAETRRLLFVGGTFAVLYNQRDPDDRLMAAYEKFVAEHSSTSGNSTPVTSSPAGLGIALLRRGIFQEEIALERGFSTVKEVHSRWRQSMSRSDFITMCQTTVQLRNIVRALGESYVVKELNEIISTYVGCEEEVIVPYLTTVLLAKRIG
jgi:ubiquinone/menaquinone biosynthesis C-methylase UbiE